MQEFMRKFEQLNGKMAKVILDHCMFGKQIIYCDNLQTINDDKRAGLVLKNQSIYVDKRHLKELSIDGDKYTMSDDRFTIIVNVNK